MDPFLLDFFTFSLLSVAHAYPNIAVVILIFEYLYSLTKLKIVSLGENLYQQTHCARE